MQFVDIELKNINTATKNIDPKSSETMAVITNENEHLPEVTLEDENKNYDENRPLICNTENSNDKNVIIDLREGKYNRTRTSNTRSKLIYFVDVFFSAFVSSPISGFFWYTIWKFTEDYFFVYSQSMSYFICYFTSFIVLAVAYILQDCLEKLYSWLSGLRYINNISCFLMRNIYIYIITVAVTVEWQGLWDLIESNIDSIETKLCLSWIAVSYACLTRSTRALVSTPFILVIDEDNDFFEYRLKSHSFFKDSVFANFVLSEVIDCLVMVVGWIGFDNSFDYYFDNYLSPEITYYSLLLIFSTSHIVYFIVAFSQIAIYKFMTGYTLILRIIMEHFINIIMFISSILLWKFYWDLGDFLLSDIGEDYIKLRIYFIGNLVTFFVGVLLKITFLLPGPGVVTFDGDRNRDKVGYFEIDYFSTLLKKSETRNSNQQREVRQNSTDDLVL